MGHVVPHRSRSASKSTPVTTAGAAIASTRSISSQRGRSAITRSWGHNLLHFVSRNFTSNISCRTASRSRRSSRCRRHIARHPVRHEPMNVDVRCQIAHVHIARLRNHLHWVHGGIRVWSSHHVTGRNRLRRIYLLLLLLLRGYRPLLPPRNIRLRLLLLLLLLTLLSLLLLLVVRIVGVRRHTRSRRGRRHGHRRRATAVATVGHR